MTRNNSQLPNQHLSLSDIKIDYPKSLDARNHPCVPPFCNLTHFDLKAIANNYAHNEGEIATSSDCNFFVITCLVGFV